MDLALSILCLSGSAIARDDTRCAVRLAFIDSVPESPLEAATFDKYDMVLSDYIPVSFHSLVYYIPKPSNCNREAPAVARLS